MFKTAVTAICLLTGFMTFGQQDAQYTHYMFNTQAINPAYAGSREALTITGLHRSQWAGFEGAPVRPGPRKTDEKGPPRILGPGTLDPGSALECDFLCGKPTRSGAATAEAAHMSLQLGDE